MNPLTNLDAIASDPAVCDGAPVVAGTTLRVTSVLDALAVELDTGAVMRQFPSVTLHVLRQVLQYATRIVRRESVSPGIVEAARAVRSARAAYREAVAAADAADKRATGSQTYILREAALAAWGRASEAEKRYAQALDALCAALDSADRGTE